MFFPTLYKNIIQEHESCASAAKCLKQQNEVKSEGSCKIHIAVACKTKKMYMNYFWSNWLEYNNTK
jgi:hypothetical protein